jgi:hypothetical protein
MSEQVAASAGIDQEFEAFREELLKKLEAWLVEIGPKADVVFIGCACGQHNLTPRDIFNQVRDRDPDGEEYARSWYELEQRMKNTPASPPAEPQ